MELNPQWHSYCDADSIIDSDTESDAESFAITVTVTITITEFYTQPDAESDAKTRPVTKTRPDNESESDTHSNGIRAPELAASNLTNRRRKFYPIHRMGMKEPTHYPLLFVCSRRLDGFAVNEQWRNVIYF